MPERPFILDCVLFLDRVPFAERQDEISEALVEQFPWLKDASTVVSFVPGLSTAFGDSVRLRVLVMGRRSAVQKLHLDGEYAILRVPSGELFWGGEDVWHLTERVAKIVEGSFSRDCLCHQDGVEIGSSLEFHLWPEVVAKIEKLLGRLTGFPDFGYHNADAIDNIAARLLRGCDYYQLSHDDLEQVAAEVLDQIPNEMKGMFQ